MTTAINGPNVRKLQLPPFSCRIFLPMVWQICCALGKVSNLRHAEHLMLFTFRMFQKNVTSAFLPILGRADHDLVT